MARIWADGIVDGAVQATMASIIDAGFELHRALGPGHLESVYHRCLAHDLRRRGHQILSEKWLGVRYLDLEIERAYRADLIIDDRVLVEIKADEGTPPIHRAQAIAYLKASGLPAGVILNFNVEYFKTGYDRLLHPALLAEARRRAAEALPNG